MASTLWFSLVFSQLLLPPRVFAEDSRLDRARRIRDEILAKHHELDRSTQQADAFEEAITAARDKLADFDSRLAAARGRAEKLASERAGLEARTRELGDAAAEVRARNDGRVTAVYRAARIGLRARMGTVAGFGAADSAAQAEQARSARLSRYLVAIAEAQSERLFTLEVELGAAIAAEARVRQDEESAVRELRVVAADRSAAETDVARAEREAEALRDRADAAVAGIGDLEASAHEAESDEEAESDDEAAAPPAEEEEPAALAEDAEPSVAARPRPGEDFDWPVQPAASGPAEGEGEKVEAEVGAAATGESLASADDPDAGRMLPVDDGSVLVPEAQPSPESPGSRPGLLSRLFGDDEDADAFASARGTLPVPVAGKVVAGYGQQHKSGATYRGVILRSVSSAAIKTVADGRVIFAGSLSGLGRTVIVSHGGRYHTVYARLGSTRVHEGDRVTAGEAVGALPEDDADLHFELRDRGKAIDPVPWLGDGGLTRQEP